MSCFCNTPIGALEIECDNIGITKIAYAGGEREEVQATGIIEAARAQLKEYFCGNRREFDLPLNPKGTEFQKRVWAELLKIPYGEVLSYGELAKRIGNPNASRAVGGANHNNPVMIVVPCHRVIGKNGSLTGYAGGIEIKRRLLELEGLNLT